MASRASGVFQISKNCCLVLMFSTRDFNLSNLFTTYIGKYKGIISSKMIAIHENNTRGTFSDTCVASSLIQNTRYQILGTSAIKNISYPKPSISRMLNNRIAIIVELIIIKLPSTVILTVPGSPQSAFSRDGNDIKS
eukprot:NODE_347_length_9026_cov_0.640641.p7 type:complete len:137 gc:universal NODE_347_length_9026_cov_0.640641:1566-1156(-)